MSQTLQELVNKRAKNHNFRKRFSEENATGHKLENDRIDGRGVVVVRKVQTSNEISQRSCPDH